MRFTLSLIILTLTAVGAQKPTCLITAPNIIHLGVEETVTVQLQGATKPAHLVLSFYHQTSNTAVSEVKHLTLNEANSYQTVVKMRVDPILYKQADEKQESSKKKIQPYIQLAAESSDVFLRNEKLGKSLKKLSIILSTKKGYIFIQTDKPIYNPGTNVNFRVFTLDNYLLPIDEIINIKIFNSKHLMVYNRALRSRKIIQSSILIPDVEMAGQWIIVASYADHPMSNSSTEFEVREYVLPTFEVKIKAFKPYYLLGEESFQFNVSARYTYGKEVNGIAYVRFGLIHEQGNRTYLPGIENKTLIQNGIASIALLTEDLRRKAENQGILHMEGYHLHIAVTALETASGDLEQAESTSVKIVTTPHIIDMSKTKKQFAPGGMFSILASTTYPDGSPAPQLRMRAAVTVKVTGNREESVEVKGLSNLKGEAVLTLKVPKQATSMSIKMFSEVEEQDVVLSDADMTVTAAQAEDESYLSVEIEHRTLEPGQQMTVTFRDITPAGTPRPSYIYYMILSKGRVVQMSRVQRTELTTLHLPFSVDLVPSFRLVAYYFREHQGKGIAPIVADSVWVDVRGVCKGQIEILPFKEHKPADVVNVEVRTDNGDKVALAAIDTAVYILNKQNKLTPQKMFDYMNSYDLACTIGGGRNYQSVLQDAGLAFITNFHSTENVRKDYTCNSRKRQKRSLNYQQEFSNIINRYDKLEERRCCYDGAKLNRLGLSCEKRHTKTTHRSNQCRVAFLKCCENASKLRDDIKRKRKTYSLARSDWDVKEEEEAINEVSVHLRSYFPQTWMWDILDVGASGHVSLKVAIPDSITTWEVQAIGISETKGFCIAEPKQLTVFQDLFVSLKLPYSVKRNEQLEVKAVVYNYRAEDLEVTVKMESVHGLCSAGGDKDTQVVTVPGNSAVPVYFTVVPLNIGNIPIHVKAYTKKAQDEIKKDLNVLGEGELVSLQHEYNIDGQAANSIKLDIPPPPMSIPGLESDAYISVKGGVMGESVENCLSLEGVDRLITLPTGCAEQTMVTMSPAIHAMKYLDATGQWIDLKAERRDEAQAMIQNGYSRILTFKKTDGSYGAFLSRPSSVWLTAFIAKELSQCRSFITVEDSYIQESISYLVSKQLQDSGAFNDPNPLYDRTMQGGVGGFEGDVSLTAFVLVAMHHALPVHSVEDGSKLRMAMMMAQSYLKSKLESLQRPFAVAITAYALSLTSAGSEPARQAQTKLRSMAKCDQEKDTCHWEANDNLRLTSESRANQVPKAESISIETTAYALLQTVVEEDMKYATRIARWLTEKRKYGGGFHSTQDTVVALEALSKFSILDNDVQHLDLSVEMCYENGRKQKVHITKHTALTLPAFQVKPGSSVTVNIGGKGNGTLSVVQTYRTLEKINTFCDMINLNVSVEGEVNYEKSEDNGPELEDYYNYESGGDQNPSDEPMSRLEWFDLHTRRKRQAPQKEERESSLVYKVCVGMNKETWNTGMAIVDISLLSGLQLNMQDLEENVKGTERYIDHYDIAPNKVFLYFNEITEDAQCVEFRATQISPMGLVQPAGAVIYDYYNPERRCGVFYSAPQKSNMISKLCKENVCSCAEGGCPKLKVTYSKNMDEQTRSSYACFSPTVDYVYVVKVINSTDDGVFKHYTTLLTNILQTGKDIMPKGTVRDMIKRKSCEEFDMKTDRDFLVMGKDKTISDTTDENGQAIYVLDNEVWIEEIPEEKRCMATKNRQACKLLRDFMEKYELSQCAI